MVNFYVLGYQRKTVWRVYDEYIDLQREGKYRIGVIANEDDKLIDGYLEAKLPESDVSIW